jgi:type IV pilus assembly protein PilC
VPLYLIKSIDKAGNTFKHKTEQKDKQSAINYVIKEGLIPTQVKKLSFLSKDIKDFAFFKSKINAKRLGFFSRQLSFLLTSGLEINKSINIIGSQNKTLKTLTQSISTNIMKGDSLSEAIKSEECFPDFYINMVKTGERSGKLPDILENLANFYENEAKLIDKVKSAMLYPAVVFIMMIALVVIALTVVVPSYAPMFTQNNIQLPLPTLILINMSDFLVNYFNYIIMVLIIGASLGWYVGFYRFKLGIYTLDYLKVNTPFVKKIYITKINLMFSKTLSLLTQSDLNIITSLEIIKDLLNNKIIDKEMEVIISKVQQGNMLAQLLEPIGYFEPMLSEMVRIGEETGELTKTMTKCSEYFQNELDIRVERINKLIEPVMTIVLGAVLGFVMLAIMLPTFYMTATF